MTLSMPPRYTKYYEYCTDADLFAGVGFSVGDNSEDDDTIINKIHWTDAPLLGSWKVLRCHGYDEHQKEIGDFPTVYNFGAIPMFSEQAWNVLKPIIGTNCEALPVEHPFQGVYYIIHVMKTVDALDLLRSTVTRSGIGDRRITRIHKYILNQMIYISGNIFKLPLLSGGGLYINDRFRNSVEDNNLKGLIFNDLSCE